MNQPVRRWRSWQLFAIAVLVWGTTWHAIVHQLAAAPPELGVALRFALAGLLALGVAAWRGERWRLGLVEHRRLALQGVFMYSLAYLCVYRAELTVPSGLVAVGYSASPLLLGVVSWLLWRKALTARYLFGGLLGLLGVGLIFAPEFAGLDARPGAAQGAAFTLAAVALSAVGSLVSAGNGRAGLQLWPAMGWGMLWGAGCSGAFALALGQRLSAGLPMLWWLSLLYLAVAGSVVAFACYLALQQRLGPGPASSVGLATPVLALLVSAALEGWRPSLASAMGVVLALAGNALALGWSGRLRKP